MKKISVVLNLVLVTVLALVALGIPGAHGAGITLTNLPAASFVGVPSSVHNDGGASEVCSAQVPLVAGDEHFGGLTNAAGSFLNFVRLPQGVKVTSLSVFGNDFATQVDFHAYLLRKLIADGTKPANGGYKVMAEADSSGAADDTIRRFTDSTVTAPKVDDAKFMYYVELVVCGPTVEPYMVQVAYTGA